MTLHLIKLCVGAATVDDLKDWHQRCLDMRARAGLSAHTFHTTRMWPRREAELLNGGSLYWVIKGQILCRQTLAGFEEEIGEDGIRRCRILLEPETVLTEVQPRRAFQGWRYLKAAEAPADLPIGQTQVPQALATELADLGLL